ncbi:hypothetical protein CVT24_001157 [Panaeolus cyanescens]|uniref:SnoaL-like domain-containing protein n=1 Tax=Panaeolus cyanescens TaxID=181874 RepID=A0A409YZ13_9AGAR|nr:hypothetical protein CVT24_001157 [Panaeolus cyanescens]
MPTQEQLQSTGVSFFEAFSSNTPSRELLGFFSTSGMPVIQHAPLTCPHPQTSRLTGSNAVRSYFDLLATHWTRSNAKMVEKPKVDLAQRRVTLTATTRWTWRKSGRGWTEDFTWTLDFDESLKILSFVARTTSPPGTCVMRAIDAEPSAHLQSSTRSVCLLCFYVVKAWRYILTKLLLDMSSNEIMV